MAKLQNENNINQVKSDYPVIAFASSREFNSWLEENHAKEKGVWLRIYKKSTGIASVDHKEALDEALCYGWIDGQGKKDAEDSYLQKFTPRGARSIWSKRNIDNILRLEKEGRMKPSGLKQVELAKADGRLERAYDSASNMVIPEDFLAELAKNKTAHAFFESLNRANKYAIVWRLQTAKKPETREKRMKVILEMMANEKKFH